MKLTTIGIDLAKNVFQVHGTDDKGRANTSTGGSLPITKLVGHRKLEQRSLR